MESPSACCIDRDSMKQVVWKTLARHSLPGKRCFLAKITASWPKSIIGAHCFAKLLRRAVPSMRYSQAKCWRWDRSLHLMAYFHHASALVRMRFLAAKPTRWTAMPCHPRDPGHWTPALLLTQVGLSIADLCYLKLRCETQVYCAPSSVSTDTEWARCQGGSGFDRADLILREYRILP
jgi:hypothetical protein